MTVNGVEDLSWLHINFHYPSIPPPFVKITFVCDLESSNCKEGGRKTHWKTPFFLPEKQDYLYKGIFFTFKPKDHVLLYEDIKWLIDDFMR